jgi:hypothetical protein
MEARKRVTIVETAHHFLYLPLHYALHANCFGCVPSNYEIGLWPAPSKTDREAYKLLMKGRAEGYEYIGFAVADPAELLHDQDNHLAPPVVLAGLITNSSFWAVDRRTHEVRFLRDLAAFDRIIAFPEGTTSHGIATRIYRDAQKTPAIQTVEPGKELTLLTDFAKGTIALTPDLLGLDKLLADQSDKYHVDLVLGKTPEYNNVLVTALLSRTDVVNDHPNLVRGLLMAIQRATLLVRIADPEVIRYAMDTYGESESRITGALRRAADAQVFPATIEVSQAHWENAGRAAADAAARQYDKNEHERVRRMFQSAVNPYKGTVMQAITDDILPRLKMDLSVNVHRSTRFQQFVEGGALGLTIGALLGVGFATWLQVPLLVFAIAVLAAAIVLTYRLPMNRVLRAIQLFWVFAGVGVVVWWWWTKPNTATLATPVWGWLGIESTILLTAVALAKK